MSAEILPPNFRSYTQYRGRRGELPTHLTHRPAAIDIRARASDSGWSGHLLTPALLIDPSHRGQPAAFRQKPIAAVAHSLRRGQ